MIVMKFGGTSVADAARILAVVDLIREHRARRPVVVVSALAGVTDLLVAAAAAAAAGDREGLEPVLADLERRHRWAVAGTVEGASRRHDLTLEIDGLFEELRQLLRSLRVLGEGSARSTDAVLAFGETLSACILARACVDRGVPARLVDPREVLVTDGRHGCAEPLPAIVAERARASLVPLLEEGAVPVMGGFVGSTEAGRTTTLGRGGSDLSASVLGSALEAEEIQIWTDVSGILSADPRLVPGARPLSQVTFAEAAELAFYGAKVLHPASIAPAVARQIPVRVLNTLEPRAPGTRIVREAAAGAPPLASVASRRGVSAARVTGGRMRVDPGFLPQVLDAFDSAGLVPDLVVSSEVAVTLVVPHGPGLAAATRALEDRAQVEVLPGRAVLCVVGSGLAVHAEVRGRVLSALAEIGAEMVAMGGSATSVAAVVAEDGLQDGVRHIHRRFFEEVPA
jgi:aspartate kinase